MFIDFAFRLGGELSEKKSTEQLDWNLQKVELARKTAIFYSISQRFMPQWVLEALYI